MAHAKFSPSAAHRWMRCPGSLVLESTVPDKPSAYAAEGTVAHEIAAQCLMLDVSADKYINHTITHDGFSFEVTKDMASHIDDYVKLVREYAGGGSLLVEQRVEFSDTINVPDSFGTADALIVHGDRITLVDLKYGMGVRVSAENNEQLRLYALGALSQYESVGDFKEVLVVIHQPRLNHVSECYIDLPSLNGFGSMAREMADRVEDAQRNWNSAPDWNDTYLAPGEKQCRFCRAKATCPALRAEITDAVGDVATVSDFADLAQVPDDQLSRSMARVDIVEQWCTAVRAEVERRLFNGESVTGWKLVEGRKGARAWGDEAAAEKVMRKALKAGDIWEKKLISPAKAEKLCKGSPSLWNELTKVVTQSAGKPSVAPAIDRRSELIVSNVADELRDLAANS